MNLPKISNCLVEPYYPYSWPYLVRPYEIWIGDFPPLEDKKRKDDLQKGWAKTLERLQNPTTTTTTTGTQTLTTALGVFLGETNHALTSTENGPHTHSTSTPDYASWQDGAANVGGGGSFNFVRLSWPVTGNSGNGTPHNTMQPTVYQNVFLKL